MTKIKLDGLRWNNIDLSRGVSEEHKALVAKRHPAPVEVKTVGAPEGGFTCDLYVAQYNFVDTEPVPTYTDGTRTPLMLPGQAVERPAEPLNPRGAPSYVRVKGANLEELIRAATGADANDMFSDVTYDEHYITAFVRNDSVYKVKDETKVVGTTETSTIYRWTGWGVTYYTGLFRPALFSQYPPLSIAQQVTVADGNAFVIDYTKTELYYEVAKTGDVYLLHGKVH